MKKASPFYGWMIVLGAVIYLALSAPIAVSLTGLFATAITEDTGVSLSQFTLANTMMQGVGILLAPVASRLLSTRHFKKIHLAMTIVYGVAIASLGFSNHLLVYYLISILMGISYVFVGIIPVAMMVSNWFEFQRGKAMSLAMTGLSVGGAIFGPLVSKWISNYGWRNTYLIYGMMLLAIGIPVSLFIYQRLPEDKGLTKLTGNGKINKSPVLDSLQIYLSGRESVGKSFFTLLIIGMLFAGLINGGGLGQFPRAFTLWHGAAFGSLLISIYSIVGIFGKLLLGWLDDKFGIKVAIIYSAGSLALVYAFMLFSSQAWAAVLAAVLFGTANSIGTVVGPLLVASLYTPENYAGAYGMVQSAQQAGMTLGSITVATIFDLTGGYQVAWTLFIVLASLVLVMWLPALKLSQKYQITNFEKERRDAYAGTTRS
ncbi:MFS transporter [Jeotgalibaca sp. A127]|uniref:MFS transporter n=1 Tax=Jeotgalibaca sp. A127 TaxID=3457324 RepID=UPI003FD2E71A